MLLKKKDSKNKKKFMASETMIEKKELSDSQKTEQKLKK